MSKPASPSLSGSCVLKMCLFLSKLHWLFWHTAIKLYFRLLNLVSDVCGPEPQHAAVERCLDMCKQYGMSQKCTTHSLNMHAWDDGDGGKAWVRQLSYSHASAALTDHSISPFVQWKQNIYTLYTLCHIHQPCGVNYHAEVRQERVQTKGSELNRRCMWLSVWHTYLFVSHHR